MEEKRKKYNLNVINAEVYNQAPDRFEIRKGNTPNTPLCPFGNEFKWIVYDKQEKEYVRVTKSVFKRLIKDLDQNSLE